MFYLYCFMRICKWIIEKTFLIAVTLLFTAVPIYISITEMGNKENVFLWGLCTLWSIALITSCTVTLYLHLDDKYGIK